MSLLIAVTAGEPAGIGPDIILMLAKKYPNLPVIVFADLNLLSNRAKRLKIKINLKNQSINDFDEQNSQPGLRVHHIPLTQTCHPGELNPQNAHYVLDCLKVATQACLEKKCDALVTGPIHKGIINQANIEFSGHTEFLASLTNTPHPVMMLMTNQMKVALVTTHLPLSKVPAEITSARLINCIKVIDHDLRARFDISNPNILVCGLNPHAGEQGHLGTEEQTIIIPTLNNLRDHGFNLTGPLPADTAFTQKNLQIADVILTMYHDQGLPVLKYQDFGHAINITLGLPIIRTSVDHGTALDLAGTNKANSDSLYCAINLAIKLINQEKSL